MSNKAHDLENDRRRIVRRSNDKNATEELDHLHAHMDLIKKELERAERIRPLVAVASSVVHDIRNSLGVISSTAQFVISSMKPADRELQAWQLVERNVDSIQRILKSYLALTRQAEPVKEPISLNEIVNRVASFLDGQLRNHNIELDLVLDPAIPRLTLDVGAIESSILNISLNAVEAMKSGGKLGLRTRNDPKNFKVLLEIEDNGHGISEENRDKIFSPFFTTKKEGTGMGLYSAKANVENNSGSILCESKSGSGTKMILSFTHKP